MKMLNYNIIHEVLIKYYKKVNKYLKKNNN